MKVKYVKKYKTEIGGHLPKFTIGRIYDVIEQGKDSKKKIVVLDNKKSMVTFNLTDDLGLCFEVLQENINIAP